ncbi:arginine biosynthesis bifunctional protein ArgJ beta chain [Artomyces pyxidatus]|uniref:Arginine biosynthesis bifunctional protein ArgJ beta chain n=1 Tax=Artomyces pyxidatus TaxID=48021 RepID=A0ACB8SXT9_9AGAM|nr:arginine biosynthesis bifunctional protein ArgJ beta chain [Artomyces pyxidatus]
MPTRIPSVWRRYASTTFTAKSAPPKTHLHKRIPDSSFPKGYLLNGVHSGVKKDSSVLDLAVILSTSPRPTSAAACFTRNAFKAAPVLVSHDVLKRSAGRARALVVNSGCANAVTGKQGLEDAWAMAHATDALLSPAPQDTSETLVMSTGVIGQTLPIAKIVSAIRGTSHATLGSGFAAWERAARAFMTTDTFPKLRARTFALGAREFRIAGIDKGAGMIHPNMGPPHATLLGCVATDAAVKPRSLQSALTYAVERSFNAISVDGDMSTNDTIVAFANGAGAEDVLEEIDEGKDDGMFEAFRDELTRFMQELAQLVVRDGEGATKFVTISVDGAASYADAHKVASKISTSALVKTALYGEDANWGRVLAATGSAELSTPLDPTRVSVSFIPTDGSKHLDLLVNGEPEIVDEARASEILSAEDLEVRVQLGLGNESAKYWTCDFSYEYVRINGDYRS